MKRLNKPSRAAIDNFDEAAQSWGWSQYFVGGSVDASEHDDYLEAKKVLEARILRLEEQNRKLHKGRIIVDPVRVKTQRITVASWRKL